MIGPPGKSEARRTPGDAKLTDDPSLRIPLSIVNTWNSEAQRLLAEFRRSGSSRHWKAYMRHTLGIAARLGGTP